MERLERLKRVVEYNYLEVIDHDHPLSVEAIGSQEPLVFEGDGEPGDEGLITGVPCRPWTDPHGHTCVAAVLECEKPLQEPVTPVVLAADESAMAGEGGGHD